jgi:hypothetical protein
MMKGSLEAFLIGCKHTKNKHIVMHSKSKMGRVLSSNKIQTSSWKHSDPRILPPSIQLDPSHNSVEAIRGHFPAVPISWDDVLPRQFNVVNQSLGFLISEQHEHPKTQQLRSL